MKKTAFFFSFTAIIVLSFLCFSCSNLLLSNKTSIALSFDTESFSQVLKAARVADTDNSTLFTLEVALTGTDYNQKKQKILSSQSDLNSTINIAFDDTPIDSELIVEATLYISNDTTSLIKICYGRQKQITTANTKDISVAMTPVVSEWPSEALLKNIPTPDTKVFGNPWYALPTLKDNTTVSETIVYHTDTPLVLFANYSEQLDSIAEWVLATPTSDQLTSKQYKKTVTDVSYIYTYNTTISYSIEDKVFSIFINKTSKSIIANDGKERDKNLDGLWLSQEINDTQTYYYFDRDTGFVYSGEYVTINSTYNVKPTTRYTYETSETLNTDNSVKRSIILTDGFKWSSPEPHVWNNKGDSLELSYSFTDISATVLIEDKENKLYTNKTLSTSLGLSSDTLSGAVTLVSSITLSKDAEVIQGNSLQLSATVDPNATNKTIKWTSSDSNLLSINSTGLVTAKTGLVDDITVTVTAITVDGSNFSASCIVKIKQPTETDKSTLDGLWLDDYGSYLYFDSNTSAIYYGVLGILPPETVKYTIYPLIKTTSYRLTKQDDIYHVNIESLKTPNNKNWVEAATGTTIPSLGNTFNITLNNDASVLKIEQLSYTKKSFIDEKGLTAVNVTTAPDKNFSTIIDIDGIWITNTEEDNVYKYLYFDTSNGMTVYTGTASYDGTSYTLTKEASYSYITIYSSLASAIIYNGKTYGYTILNSELQIKSSDDLLTTTTYKPITFNETKGVTKASAMGQ